MFTLKSIGTALLLASSLVSATAPWEVDNTDDFCNLARGREPASELEINSRAGPVVGHYAKNGADTTVREFLGIPYARAPTGILRFLPAVPAPRWGQPFNASAFGPACYNSKFIGSLGNAPINLTPPEWEDEDCLHLNIWAPSKARLNGKKAAVMVWGHGGGFLLGQSNSYLWNGGSLVRDQEDVIVVTFNYRLNVFGYPAAPGLPSKLKNPGLLDIRRVIEWVESNIAAYGGDASKITLFGESAGGAATDAYLYYSAPDPIIHGAIMQSGSVQLATDNLFTHPNPEQSWATLSTTFNCPVTPHLRNLRCLQEVPAADLRDAVNTLSLEFTPVMDEGTLFSDYRERLKTGEFARVPVLAGSNDQELPGLEPQWVEGTRVTFTCPAANQAKYHAQYVPTWQYRYFGTWTAGSAFHGSEIAQVFGLASTPASAVESSKYIQGAWAAFAKDPVNGLVAYGWPKFDPAANTLIGLAKENTTPRQLLNPEDYQSGCYF